MWQPEFVDPLASFGSRREFLSRMGNGAGILALATLLDGQRDAARAAELAAATRDARSARPQASAFSPPRQIGHLALYERRAKPRRHLGLQTELEKRDGRELEGFDKNTGFFTGSVGPVMKSPFQFQQHGQSGAWVSEIFRGWRSTSTRWPSSSRAGPTRITTPPHSSRSTPHGPHGVPLRRFVGVVWTGGRDSQPAGLCRDVRHARSRHPQGARPELGGGILARRVSGDGPQTAGGAHRESRTSGGVTVDSQRAQLDLLATLNRRHLERAPHEPELAARLESFELAYRMQMSAPEVLDLGRESAATQSLYGLDNPKCAHFAKQCLLARRMVEQGVRFVQIYSGGMENERSWDGHSNIKDNHGGFAAETDQPISALLTDLASRAYSIPRSSSAAASSAGSPSCKRRHRPRPQPARVHHMDGGRRREGGNGLRRNGRDRLESGRRPVSINDLHATILHLLASTTRN